MAQTTASTTYDTQTVKMYLHYVVQCMVHYIVHYMVHCMVYDTQTVKVYLRAYERWVPRVALGCEVRAGCGVWVQSLGGGGSRLRLRCEVG